MLISQKANNGKFYGYIIVQPATNTSLASINLIREFQNEIEVEEFKENERNNG